MADIDSSKDVPEVNINFFPTYSHAQFAEALLAVTEYAAVKAAESKGKTFLNEKWADFFPQVEEADRLFFV